MREYRFFNLFLETLSTFLSSEISIFAFFFFAMSVSEPMEMINEFL